MLECISRTVVRCNFVTRTSIKFASPRDYIFASPLFNSVLVLSFYHLYLPSPASNTPFLVLRLPHSQLLVYDISPSSPFILYKKLFKYVKSEETC